MRDFMKYITFRPILLILLVLIINSCKNESKNYFTFDEIVQYKLNPEINTELLFSEVLKTGIDSLRREIIINEKPSELKDSLFIRSLDKVGFEKVKVNPFKYHEIKDIYRERSSPFIKTSTTCEPIYRDILIFKLQNKITGISKICFECQKSQNIGINGKLKSFERESDFKNLKNFLQ